jgi:O-antigen/teichoic acid export membrane protein
MANSRTKNSMLILSSGIILQVVTALLAFISRTIFINTLGAEYLGISGLFTNIISILSLAELGVGSAITFYLYKPLAENNIERIKTLMMFYKLCYRVIGVVILLLGLLCIPIVPKIVNYNTKLDVNIIYVFVLYLVNTAVTYLFFSYRFTLIIASQKGYVINLINIVFAFILIIADAIVLIIFRNFILYITMRIFIGILLNVITSIKAGELFPYIKEKEYIKITADERRAIFKDIYAIFITKVSGTLFSATDNIIISILIGTIYVGYNSNYFMIIIVITTFIGILQNSFIASVGNINAIETNEKQIDIFENLDFLNFWVTSFCAVCLANLLNPFISLWIGKEFLFSNLIVAVIAFNFFTTNLLNIVFIFRNTKGLFQYAKYRQLIAGIANILLSIILGKMYGIIGIFAATSICGILISWSPYPKTLYKFGFNIEYRPFLNRTIMRYIITIGIGVLIYSLSSLLGNNTWAIFIIRLCISVIIPNLVLFIIYRHTKEFIYIREKAISYFKG